MHSRCGLFVVLGVLFLNLLPADLRAQGGELARVDQLVESGHFLSARDALEAWWEASWDTASRPDRQQAIWLRALLTIDPAMAELDYRRLVVEYPGGAFSDESLLRLAHGARARGENAEARQYLDILVRDYPQSPHRVEARSLLSRMAEGAVPTEAAEVGGSAPPEDIPPPSATSEVTQAAPYAVQMGAFSTEAGARALANEVGSTVGDPLRIVRLDGSNLVRVRLGRFQTRDEAEGQARELRALGLEAVVASDGDREVVIP